MFSIKRKNYSNDTYHAAENKDVYFDINRFIVNDDGMVGPNFDHPDVQKDMGEVISYFSKMEFN